MKKRRLAYLALAGAALIWGASMPLVKPALAYITPFQFLFLRYAVATPLVLPLILKTIKNQSISLKHIPEIILLEVISLSNLVLVYAALEFNTAIQQSLLMDVRPLFVTFAGILFLKEVEEKNEWIGLLIALLGTVLVIIAPIIGNGSLPVKFSFAGLLILLTTHVIAAISTIFIKRSYRRVPKTSIAGIHVWIGFILFGLLNVMQNNLPSISTFTNPIVLVPVMFMAIFGSIIGLSLQLYGYNQIEASEATLFSYLQPLAYIPLSMYLLNETVHPFQLIGIAIIALGVFLAEQRKGFKFLKETPERSKVLHKVTHYR